MDRAVHALYDYFNGLSIAFLYGFIVFLSYILFSSTRGIDLSVLYKSEFTGRLSHTKFWTNIAYFAATLAFINMNLFTPVKDTGSLEIIWVIYLGIVASDNIATKYLLLKYGTDMLAKHDYDVSQKKQTD